MSTALQPHLRQPHRSDLVSKRIFDDFLGGRKLAGSRVLELGPGQYDLVRMVEATGALVTSMDRDPAVIALGKKRGYNVILADFRRFDWKSHAGTFDGLLCRGSITPSWFRDADAAGGFVDAICSVLKPNGWGWIAPWYSGLDEIAPAVAEAERQGFERSGFRCIDPDQNAVFRYGLGVNRARLFLKGFDIDTAPSHRERGAVLLGASGGSGGC